MKTFFLIGFLFISVMAFAQDGKTLQMENDSLRKARDEYYEKIFTKPEIEPSYIGGDEAWQNYIHKHLWYPFDALDSNIEGTVMVQFVVDKNGHTNDVIAISGATDAGLREEAVRLVKKSGRWMPGMKNGRPVNAYKTIPIVFKLNHKD